MFISAQFMPWIVSFLFPGCFLFIYLFCLFLVHSFIYRPLQGLKMQKSKKTSRKPKKPKKTNIPGLLQK